MKTEVIYNFAVGNKVYFQGERMGYTIMAMDARYLICQKPFNPKNTFQYCIVDLEKGIRGPDNYYCKFNYDRREDCEQALRELNTGELEISYRRRAELEITKVKELNKE